MYRAMSDGCCSLPGTEVVKVGTLSTSLALLNCF